MEQLSYGHSSCAWVKSCGLRKKSWAWSRLKILSCTIFEGLFLTQTNLLIHLTGSFQNNCFGRPFRRYEIKRPGPGRSSSQLCYWTNSAWKHTLAHNSEAKTRDGSLGWGYRSLDGSHSLSNENTARSGVELGVASSNPIVWLCLRADDIWKKVIWKDRGMERGLLSSLHRWDCWNSCWCESPHFPCEHQEWFRLWFHTSWACFQTHWNLWKHSADTGGLWLWPKAGCRTVQCSGYIK